MPYQIIHSRNSNVNVTLTVQANLDKEKMAQKLHQQFAHSSSEKLLIPVNSAGSTWSQDNKLKEKIKPICKNCPVCLIYKKSHNQLLACHLLQNSINVCYGHQILQRIDFTLYDRSHYKVVYYCNLAFQEARPDS